MPFEWPNVRLGSCCSKIGSGATPKGGKSGYFDVGPFCLFRSQNVLNEGFVASGLAFISEVQAQKLDNVSVQEQDILLNITGDSVARSCMAPAKHLPARVNQHVAIIRPDPQRLDPYFLRYVMISPQHQEVMMGLAASGATRNALTKSMIEGFQVPCPPIHTQRIIGQTLRSFEDRIHSLEEITASLEAIAQAIFKSWFVDFDPVRAKAEGREPEGMDAATAALFPSEFQESEIGLIPLGWRAGNLGQLMTMQGGTQPAASEFKSVPTDGYVRLLQIRDYSSEAHPTYIPITAKLRYAAKDDVLIGRYGSGSGDREKDSLGRLLRGLEGVINVAIVKVLPVKPTYREWISVFIQSGFFYRAIVGGSSRAVQAGFRQDDLAFIKIALPPEAVFVTFDNMALSFWEKRKANLSIKATLTNIRETLLPKLISGQIRVPEAEAMLDKAL